MASANVKKPCATCKKNAGVTTCHGCLQPFCIKHFLEHRQGLSQLIDNIGQEHDLLRRDLEQHSVDHSFLSRIDIWEQESIAKIQVTAEEARADLHELLDKNTKQLRESVTKITDELQACRVSDDYTEIDINKWTEQLQKLRKTFESPSTIRIDESETRKSTIHLIRVREQQQHHLPDPATTLSQHRIFADDESISSSNERFNEISGPVKVSDDGLVATCQTGYRFSLSTIFGVNRYSSGKHCIRFRIEQIGSFPMFFGMTASSVKIEKSFTNNKALYGWRGPDEIVMKGRGQRSENNNVIKTGDEVTLILDCDNRQIQLQLNRTHLLLQLDIDFDNGPFSWKTVVTLPSTGDSIRILQ